MSSDDTVSGGDGLVQKCPGDNTFTCKNGDVICDIHKCDGEKQCSDGSDEDECGEYGASMCSVFTLFSK